MNKPDEELGDFAGDEVAITHSDKDRLLTDKEINKALGIDPPQVLKPSVLKDNYYSIAKAQRDLTASIKDAEYQTAIETISVCHEGELAQKNTEIEELKAINEKHRILNGELRAEIQSKDAGCQARVEGIFKDIEKSCKGYKDNTVGHLLSSTYWQVLKRQELPDA